jgi:endonuclease/exonuclease/phosphatase family metal-dependent hydrolase
LIKFLSRLGACIKNKVSPLAGFFFLVYDSVMTALAILLIVLGTILLFLNLSYRYARWSKIIPVQHAPAVVEEFPRSADTAKIKVLSLNVKMIDWHTSVPTRILSRLLPHKRRARIINFLEKCDHDVVLLQEAFNVGFQERVVEALHEKFPFSVSYRPNAPLFRWINNGLMILSRYPIVQTEIVEFSKLVGTSWWVPKGAIAAKIAGPKEFSVVNTHMQAFEGLLNDKYRIHGATVLQKFIDEKIDQDAPVIIGGDFNTSQRHTYLRALCRLFGVKLYQLDGDQRYSWDPVKNPLATEPAYQETLDWIFVRDLAKKVKHVAARILPIELSDHYPVEREIVIE